MTQDDLRSLLREVVMDCLAECGVVPKKPRKKKAKPLITFDPVVMATGRYATPEFLAAWRSFVDYRAARKKPLTEHSASLVFNKFNQWSVSECISSIHLAIENNWTTVYRPAANRFRKPETNYIPEEY